MGNVAICIGNNYPGTYAELNGCVRDAQDWSELLFSAGYEVKTLIEATKQQVVTTISDVLGAARFGDRVVITYSGHGTQIPDRNGDEIDGIDEAWVLADFQQGGLLKDDELETLLLIGRTYGVGRLILSDSCFSATMTRLFTPNVQAKYISPVELNLVSQEQWRAIVENDVPKNVTNPKASLISGCAEDEVSYDAYLDGKYNGAFTYYATRAYQPGMTLKNWYKAIRTMLPNGNFPQEPILSTQSPYRLYSRAL